MAYSFGGGGIGSGSPRRQTAPQSMGPPRAPEGPMSFGNFARVTQGHVDPNWLSALHDWWDRHGYYPEQAAKLGQDGTVGIEIVVNKYGSVIGLRLDSRSGSAWLDLGAQSVFRGARLPSLMPFTSDEQITVELTINYILVRQ